MALPPLLSAVSFLFLISTTLCQLCTQYRDTNIANGEGRPAFSTLFECMANCATDSACYGFDWDKSNFPYQNTRCWFHLADTICKPTQSNDCCDHYRCPCLPDPCEDFFQSLHMKKIGASQVNAVSEAACVELCRTVAPCGGVDWNKKREQCWQHSVTNECSKPVVEDDCCNHYMKNTLPCFPTENFTRTANRNKKGAAKVDRDSVALCLQLCGSDDHCAGADWDKQHEECWLHSRDTECSSPLTANNCCDHYRKKSLSCTPSEDFTKSENMNKDGALEVLAVSEGACVELCRKNRNCGGLDWDKEQEKCWLHTTSNECAKSLQANNCCNHYTSNTNTCNNLISASSPRPLP